MDFEAWRCKHDDKLFCPDEGCAKAEGCARDRGEWPMRPLQKKMARHALGLVDGRKTSYRNRFYIARCPGADMDAWTDMARRGLAQMIYDSPNMTGFALTHDGAKAALNKGERLDKEDFPS